MHTYKDAAEGRIPCALPFRQDRKLLPSLLPLSAPSEMGSRVSSSVLQLSTAVAVWLSNSACHKSDTKLASFLVSVVL